MSLRCWELRGHQSSLGWELPQGWMVPTAFTLPEAHAVGQRPLGALDGDAVLDGLPQPLLLLAPILLHAGTCAKGQHRVTADPRAHDAAQGEDFRADHVPRHGSSWMDGFGFASDEAHSQWGCAGIRDPAPLPSPLPPILNFTHKPASEERLGGSC